MTKEDTHASNGQKRTHRCKNNAKQSYETLNQKLEGECQGSSHSPSINSLTYELNNEAKPLDPPDPPDYASNIESDTENYASDAESVAEAPWTNDAIFSISTDNDDELYDVPLQMDSRADLFMRRAYVIHGSIGSSLLHMYTQRITIDTGAGPNIIRKDLVPKELVERIEKCNDPGMIGATGDSLQFLGVVRIVACIMDLRVRINFAVVESLPPGILLGTSFIDRFVKQIDPQNRLVRFLRSKLAPILASVKINRTTNRFHSEKTPPSSVSDITHPEPLTPWIPNLRNTETSRSN